MVPLSPIIRAQENLIGQKQRAKERQEDRDHAERMAQLTAKLNEDQTRLAASLKLGNEKEIAKLNDQIADDNRLIDFENQQNLVRLKANLDLRQAATQAAITQGLDTLSKTGNAEPLQAALNLIAGGALLQADERGELGEPSEDANAVSRVLDLSVDSPWSRVIDTLGDESKQANRESIQEVYLNFESVFRSYMEAEGMAPSDTVAQLSILKDELSNFMSGNAAGKSFDPTEHGASMQLARGLMPRIDAAITAKEDAAEVIAVENNPEEGHKQFAPQFNLAATGRPGFSVPVVEPTGNPSSDVLRRRFGSYVAQFESKFQHLTQLATKLADPSQDLRIEDLPEEDRPFVESLLQRDEEGNIIGHSRDVLMDHLMGNRENAPGLLTYLRQTGDARFENMLSVSSDAAAERRFVGRTEAALANTNLNINGELASLNSLGFELNPDYIEYKQEGDNRIPMLATGAEVGFVQDMIEAHGITGFDPLNPELSPVQARQILVKTEEFATKLGLTDADILKLNRTVSTNFERVKAEAYTPEHAFESITQDSQEIDNHPAAVMFFNPGGEFFPDHPVFARDEPGYVEGTPAIEQFRGLSPAKIGKRSAIRNWRRELKNELRPSERKKIYTKYGFEQFYSPEVDKFLRDGGSTFVDKVLEVSIRGVQSEQSIVEQQRDQLALDLARMEATQDITTGSGKVDYERALARFENLGLVLESTVEGARVEQLATKFYKEFGRAVAFGPDEVYDYIEANRVQDTGVDFNFDADGAKEKLKREIELAYTGDFETTLGNLIAMYLPENIQAQFETPSAKGDFNSYIFATHKNISKGLVVAS